MPLFRRGRPDPEDEDLSPQDVTEDVEDVEPDGDDADAPGFVDAPELGEAYARDTGPYDLGEEPADEQARLDLGALRVMGYPGLEIRLELDEETGSVVSVTAVSATGAVQLQAFAAPRSSGIWDEVRGELAASIGSSGGRAEVVAGPFGRELLAQVPVDGGGREDVRFVGVDGPRWFLRGVLTGAAYEAGGEPQLEDVFRATVVVRGDAPMAPTSPLPLHLPDDAQAEPDPVGRPPLQPFRRGPEITEIH